MCDLVLLIDEQLEQISKTFGYTVKKLKIVQKSVWKFSCLNIIK